MFSLQEYGDEGVSPPVPHPLVHPNGSWRHPHRPNNLWNHVRTEELTGHVVSEKFTRDDLTLNHCLYKCFCLKTLWTRTRRVSPSGWSCAVSSPSSAMEIARRSRRWRWRSDILCKCLGSELSFRCCRRSSSVILLFFHRFFELFEKYGGYKSGKLKLKKPKQLQVCDIFFFPTVLLFLPVSFCILQRRWSQLGFMLSVPLISGTSQLKDYCANIKQTVLIVVIFSVCDAAPSKCEAFSVTSSLVLLILSVYQALDQPVHIP